MKGKNAVRKLLIIILLLTAIIWALFFITDYNRAQNNKRPIFAIETSFYSDGGTREYIGLGYKVIAYAVIDEGITDEIKCKIGTWFLSYDENFTRKEEK